MATDVSKTFFIKTLQEKRLNLFSYAQAKILFNIENDNTLKHLLRRLKKDEIITSLARGRYLFNLAKNDPSEYEIANFLYSPSYISLETGLNFYNFITQFPYEITSVTVKKTKEIEANNQVYSYSKIKKDYFRDYILKNDFLIAPPHKVLFDYYYFCYKGLKSLRLLNETDEKLLKSKKICNYLRSNTKGKFKKYLQNEGLI